jgi:hypothetical protein
MESMTAEETGTIKEKPSTLHQENQKDALRRQGVVAQVYNPSYLEAEIGRMRLD